MSADHDVIDTERGEKIGALMRRAAIRKDAWELYGPEGMLMGKMESGSGLSVSLMRVLTGGIAPHYNVIVGDQKLGEFRQSVEFNPPVIRATMDLRANVAGTLDRGLALAAGILLLLFFAELR